MNTELLQVVSITVSTASCIASIAAVIIALYIAKRAERPEVIVYLAHDRDVSAVSLVVENIGRGTAKDIQFCKFDYKLVDDELIKKVRESFLEKGVPTLVPEASRSTIILAGGALYQLANESSTVVVQYKGTGFIRKLKLYTEEFTLDYYSLSGSIYMKSDLYLIRKDLDSIAKSLNGKG